MIKTKTYKIIKYGLLLCVLTCGTYCSGYSQKKDSLKVYKKIKKWAYKHKLGIWAYDAIFVEPAAKEYPIQPASKEQKNVNPYLKYKGKTIRNINITVYDPFGHNVADTVLHNINSVQRFGNNLHITTRHFVIINKLLFKNNTPVKPLELSETERNLRQAVFISDARIYITPSKTNKDSVDVNVVVQDKWPITIPILITDVSANAKFRNQNLFGVGQQFEQYAGFKRPDRYDFNGYYGIANMDNTYISSQLSYKTEKDLTQVSISFDRPFYSPLSTWAGGVAVGHTWRVYNYTDTIEKTDKHLPINNIAYDVWVGKSMKLSDDTSLFSQSTNIILSARHFNSRYIKRPPYNIDSSKTIYNSHAILGNIGFAVQQYYKDKYIYRFGANEDVPEGLIVQTTYGVLKNEYKKLRYYVGAEIARAKRYKFGYLSTTLSHGIFFNKDVTNDVTTHIRLYYFSDLFKLDGWYWRQFLNFKIVHGEHKLENETTNVNSDDLYGFDGSGISGNTKIILNSETVTYLPYNAIGFRFAPVASIGLGMLGSPEHPIIQSNLFQAYSIGIMIRNENLLSSTFQFSVGVYPFLPNGKKNVALYNPISSFTLRVRSFSVSRPEFITY